MSQTETQFTYEHHGISFVFSQVDEACGLHVVTPGGVSKESLSFTSIPPVQLAVGGLSHGNLPAVATGQTDLAKQLRLVSHQSDESGLQILYRHDELGLVVTVTLRGVQGSAVVRSTTTVHNDSSHPVTITHLSSALLQGIATEGTQSIYDEGKIRVHYCRQSWAGEGQWRESSLEELGLYPTAKHSTRAALHIASEGSWSTSRYAPVIVLEDKESSQAWYAQIETSSPWHFEVGVRGSMWDKGLDALYLQVDGSSERVGGWSKQLLPGESFESVPVAVGCCNGDFTDAIRELTAYRRSELRLDVPVFHRPPVVFNDYMNCLFAEPTRDKLLPLIDAAANVGAEVYCIDAGWFGSDKPGVTKILGDWVPNDGLFGEEGLKGILQYIRARGMLPGIWMELEVCGEDAVAAENPDDWFLQIRGKRVGGGERTFFNFTNRAVREYLHTRIDFLIGLGVRYIKNDYNACVGLGDDVISSSPADGLLQNARAFYHFIDEVRARHPELILENCSCGAMRTDYGAQSHFHLASYSDQENYLLAPSILGGTLGAILPEQLGIWAYPFPLEIKYKDKPEVLDSDAYRRSQEDGEQTIFNMVNGLCGVPYLSGRIDKADETNTRLIEEAVHLFKREVLHLRSSYPVWPLGFSRIGDREGWASTGLQHEDGNRLLLAVWRRESPCESCKLPLRGFVGHRAVVRQLYPFASHEVPHEYSETEGTLTVQFAKQNQARFFEITRLSSRA